MKLFYDDVFCCSALEEQQKTKCPYDMSFLKDFYNKYFVIGYTINLPRVKIFNKASTADAQRIYRELIHDALKKLEKNFLIRYIVKYELCKDSKTHSHGIFYFSKEISKISIAGLLHDINNVIQQTANKALKRYNVNNAKINYSDEYKRIHSPMVTLQFMKDDKEFVRWIKYIYKQQDESQYIGVNFTETHK